jgi:putative transposase
MQTYLKVAFALSAILGKTERISQVLKNDLSSFVLTVQRYSKNIDLKLILRLCKVPISVYYNWRNRVLKPFETSPVWLCKKTWPHQLSAKEVLVMKNLLLGERFRFWPVCSIAFYAIREKILSVSLPTWYLYQRKLGITRPKLPKKKSMPPVSVQTGQTSLACRYYDRENKRQYKAFCLSADRQFLKIHPFLED